MADFKLLLSPNPLTNGFGFGVSAADVAKTLDDLSTRLKSSEAGLVVDSIKLEHSVSQKDFAMKTLTVTFAEKTQP